MYRVDISYNKYLYYVDWNAGGDFDDQDERTYLGSGGPSNYYMTFHIEVPDFVSPGEKAALITFLNTLTGEDFIASEKFSATFK